MVDTSFAFLILYSEWRWNSNKVYKYIVYIPFLYKVLTKETMEITPIVYYNDSKAEKGGLDLE